MSARLAAALAVAALASAYVLISPLLFPAYAPDFDQFWIAGHAWRQGENPYQAVAEYHQRRGVDYNFVYPFTMIVALLPLTFLPLVAARVVFTAIAAGSLTYLLLGRGWWLFPVLLSGSFRAALSLIQAAPITAASVLAPGFGWIAACKPNTGVAAAFAQRSWHDVVRFAAPALALAILSFVLWPSWLPEWRAGVATGVDYVPLAFRAGGALLLLAGLRWRLPEARWLFVTALLPGTPAPYDALPLLVMLPRTLRQSLVFALLSALADFGAYVLPHADTIADTTRARAIAVIWLLYVPALVVILRRSNIEQEKRTRPSSRWWSGFSSRGWRS